MTLSITQKQQQVLQTFSSKGDYKGGWKYLASIGDNYADNAYAVTTGLSVSSSTTKKQIDDLMFHLVQKYWDTVAGPSAYSDKFSAVAEQHFRQYTQFIVDQNGELPNTDQIERSYRQAVTDQNLPSEIAIDGAITRSFGEFFDNIWPGEKNESFDWGDALGMGSALNLYSYPISKLVTVDKNPDHDVMHCRQFGEANCSSGKAFNASA